MEPDPKARSGDPHRALQRVFSVREGLRLLRLLLGLCVLLFLTSLVGAGLTGDLHSLYLHMILWCLAQLAAIAVCLLALRGLRRRRFGTQPSARLRSRGDVLLHVLAVHGGLLALLAYAPRVDIDAAPDLDWLVAGLGLALLIAGLRGAVLYTTRA